MTCETPIADLPVEGAVGFEIFISTGLDLSSASAITIRWQAPDGTTGEWTATADSKDDYGYGASYVTEDGDLDQDGTWYLQVAVEDLNGFTGAGRKVKLRVLPAIEIEAP